jgi:hypothetical protein
VSKVINVTEEVQQAPEPASFTGRHPRLAAAGRWCVDAVIYLKEGQIIVDFGRWIVRFGGRVTESAMLIATLYITASVAVPELIAFLPGALRVWSIAVFNLAPEIILAPCVITAYKLARGRRWFFSGAYGFMALGFLALTVAMFLMFLSSNGTAHSNAVMLGLRTLSGWLYSFVTTLHAGIDKYHHQEQVQREQDIEELRQTIDAMRQEIIDTLEMIPEPPQINDLAQQIIGQLQGPMNDLRLSVLREVQTIQQNQSNDLDQRIIDVTRSMIPNVDHQTIIRQIIEMLPSSVDHRQIIDGVMPMIRSQITLMRRDVEQQIIADHRAKQPEMPVESLASESAETRRERERRLEKAFQDLLQVGQTISGLSLSEVAKCNRNAATLWLREHHPEHAKSRGGSRQIIDGEAKSIRLISRPDQSDQSEHSA